MGGLSMEVKVTVVVIDRGSPQVKLTKCLESVTKQTLVDKEILLISPKTEVDAAVDMHLVQPATGSFSQLLRLVAKYAQGEFISILEAENFYLNEQALAKNLADLATNKADLGVAPLVVLDQGTFYFKTNPTNVHKLVTTNNIIPYMRLFEAFRYVQGSLFSRELLVDVLAEQAVKTEQQLLYYLVHTCQKAVLLPETLCCFVLTEGHQLPAFKWEEAYRYSNAQSFVQAIKQSDYHEEIPDRIQLTIGVDDGLILHLEALVHSLDKNTDTPIDLYIIYASLTAESISRVKFINDKLEAVTLILRPIPKESRQFIENINMDKARLPIGTYFRIIVPEVLTDLDRVIYLDTDMVVNASLKPLWQTPLEGNFIGACEDSLVFYHRRVNAESVLFGKQGERYFNAGMMLMDLKLMRQYSTSFYSAQLALDTADVIKYADQDVQNLYFYGANKQIDLTYNYGLEYVQYTDRPLSEVAIIHYYGWKKPWMNMVTETFMHPSRRPAMHLYRQYHNEMKAILGDNPDVISVILAADQAQSGEFERCFEGFLTQTYTNLELLIVTAKGLTSDLQTYLKTIKPYYPNIKVVTGTMAQAVKQSQGSYLYFFNLDNLLSEKTALAQLVAACQQGVQVVYSGYQRLDLQKKVIYWQKHRSNEVRALSLAEHQKAATELTSLDGLLVTKGVAAEIVRQSGGITSAGLLKAATKAAFVDRDLWIQSFNKVRGETNA